MLETDTIAAHVERIARDGFAIIERAIEPDLVDTLAAGLEDLERLYDVQPARPER